MAYYAGFVDHLNSRLSVCHTNVRTFITELLTQNNITTIFPELSIETHVFISIYFP